MPSPPRSRRAWNAWALEQAADHLEPIPGADELVDLFDSLLGDLFDSLLGYSGRVERRLAAERQRSERKERGASSN